MDDEVEAGILLSSVGRAALIKGSVGSQIAAAIDEAASNDKVTWLTDGGRRIAAIVPVAIAETGLEEIPGGPR